MLGTLLHMAFSHVTQKILSKIAHPNTTFRSFSLLFHFEHRSVQEFLAAPPLCYVFLVNVFFPVSLTGHPQDINGK